VDVEVHERLALHDGPGHLAHVVALGRLDLDHVGAEIGQKRGQLARSEQGAFDHAHARERAGRRRRAHSKSPRESSVPGYGVMSSSRQRARPEARAWSCQRARRSSLRSSAARMSDSCPAGSVAQIVTTSTSVSRTSYSPTSVWPWSARTGALSSRTDAR